MKVNNKENQYYNVPGEWHDEGFYFEKQMLIGYMIEYLFNKSHRIEVYYPDIEDIYNDLKERIEEL